MKLYKVIMAGEAKILGIMFSEVDSLWHFVDLAKENIRWEGYQTKEQAEAKLQQRIERGTITQCVPFFLD